MNREAITKGVMVALLLGALGATVVLTMNAEEKPSKAQTEVSEDDAEKELMRREIRAIIRKAIMAHRQLDYEAAEKMLEEASEKYPRVAAVWLNLGICYGSLNKLDAADRAFARVLEIDPKDWDAVAEKATVRAMRGKDDEALDLLATIPSMKGQVTERLRGDPRWIKLRGRPKMKELLRKHGVVIRPKASSDGPMSTASATTSSSKPN
ncbi:MAG: tetratricopeptide repeat protein [Myxococcota bacterium]